MSDTVTISKADAIAGYEMRAERQIALAKDQANSAYNDWPSYRSDVRQELEHARTHIDNALQCISQLEALGALKSNEWGEGDEI